MARIKEVPAQIVSWSQNYMAVLVEFFLSTSLESKKLWLADLTYRQTDKSYTKSYLSDHNKICVLMVLRLFYFILIHARFFLLGPNKLILVLKLIIGVPRLCKNVNHVHWVYHLNIQLYVPFKDFWHMDKQTNIPSTKLHAEA